MTKMAKTNHLFMTKKAENPVPYEAMHTCTGHIREYPTGEAKQSRRLSYLRIMQCYVAPGNIYTPLKEDFLVSNTKPTPTPIPLGIQVLVHTFL